MGTLLIVNLYRVSDKKWKSVSHSCNSMPISELKKVPSSAILFLRKDFGFRKKLRKAPEGKNLKRLQLQEKKRNKEKMIKNSFLSFFKEIIVVGLHYIFLRNVISRFHDVIRTQSKISEHFKMFQKWNFLQICSLYFHFSQQDLDFF